MDHKTSLMEEELLQAPTKRSWDALADAGMQAVVGAYNSASSFLNNKHDNGSRKQGSLSLRASYMLVCVSVMQNTDWDHHFQESILLNLRFSHFFGSIKFQKYYPGDVDYHFLRSKSLHVCLVC